MEPKQFAAIKFSLKKAIKLQGLHPEIADDYKNGMTLQGIAAKYEIQNLFGVLTSETASRIVYCALSGNLEGRFGYSFEGLLTNEELSSIGKNHMSNHGLEMVSQERGMFGWTDEQKRGYRSKGFISWSKKKRKAHGNSVCRRGLGIHAMTSKERKEAARKATISRGKVPWEEGEKLCAYLFSKSKFYQRGSLVKNGKIAREINTLWHGGRKVRSTMSLAHMLCKYK
ncbi:hypothetical protein CMI37_36460 [Candidatus Pacearchaeota archaeon]|nr:hypothetical protein [Candidatus Pacearchaeota archaeon]|tara:strand:- start:4068 stop:4748 length:681 start_codon:yes stop_codon:yes gene_type:complete